MLDFSSVADNIISVTSEMNTPKFCKSLIPTTRAIGELNQIKHVKDLTQWLALRAKKNTRVASIFSTEVFWLKLLRDGVY